MMNKVNASLAIGLAILCTASAVAAAAVDDAPALRGGAPQHAPRKLWGPQGHEITAAIADRLISSAVQSAVSNILGSGNTLQSVSTWADDVKHESQWSWSQPLHFLNTPDWFCGYTLEDCFDGMCVPNAILNYTTRLQSAPSTSAQDVPLKFITHFVGDIHQPLHVAFLSDKGGNDYKGDFLYNEDTTLHDVWDTHIIDARLSKDFDNSMDDYIAYLYKHANASYGTEGTVVSSPETFADDVHTWAQQTGEAACKYAYVDSSGTDITNGFRLYDSYYKFAYPIVDQQLILGGQRLASTLETFLGSSVAATSASTSETV